jgi:hypothetical protein
MAASMVADRTPTTTARKSLVNLATTKATSVFVVVLVVPALGAAD